MQSFTILTWNIQLGTNQDRGASGWPARSETLARILLDLRPDVICCQEVSPDQFDFLAGLLSHAAYSGSVSAGTTARSERCPIFYRSDRFRREHGGTFWFSRTPTQGSRAWGEFIPRICTWAGFHDESTGLDFRIFNPHMPLNPFADGKASRLLVAQMRDSELPTIVAGDLNSGPFSPTLRILAKAGFKDADSQRRPTYRRFGMEFRPDHILVDSNWRVDELRIVGRKADDLRASDHLGLMATVRLDRLDV